MTIPKYCPIGGQTRIWLPAILLGMAGLAFVVGPMVVDGRIPGDLRDARLISYFLEHFYRWINRQDTGFWHSDFFYPFPLTTAFSDNFLGNGFVYAVPRALGLDREDAFRIWIVIGLTINYPVANYALVRLGYSGLGAAVGAFLFAFGLPVTAQLGHAQLLWRFGVPLAVLAFEKFRLHGQLRQLALIAFWTTWQFYCSIYIGYFLALLLLAFVIGHALCHAGGPTAAIRSVPRQAVRLFAGSSAWAKGAFALTVSALAALMIMLAVPYREVSRLYGFHRNWGEIEPMLPRPVSYLLTTNSRLWPFVTLPNEALPMWHEHAMFIGIAPFLAIAVALALRLAGRGHSDRLFVPTSLVVAFLVLLTLWVDGASAYRIAAWLPGADAVRAVTRIIVVLLFPCGMLLASSLDTITTARCPGWARTTTVALISVLVVVESSCIQPLTTTRTDWLDRMAMVSAELPRTMPSAPLLLLSPSQNPSEGSYRDIDAMLFAQDHGWATLNGYSGNDPPTGRPTGQCRDIPPLLGIGLKFRSRATRPDYVTLVHRIVTLGYPTCNEAMLLDALVGPAPEEMMSHIRLHIERLAWQAGHIAITASITNESSMTVPAYSTSNMQLRLSARYVDVRAQPSDLRSSGDWVSRQDIVADIPAGQSQRIEISMAPPAVPGTYRVALSMVQEMFAWFHNHGMPIPISEQTVVVDDHSVRVSNDGSSP